MLIGLAITLALFVAVSAVEIARPDALGFNFGTAQGHLRTLDRSGPVGGLTAGSLELDYGAAALSVGAEDLGQDLYRAHFEVSPDVTASADIIQPGGLLRIKLNSDNHWCFFGCQEHRARLNLTLNSRLPWRISLAGGASEGTIDAGSLKLSRFDLSAGASNLSLTLPTPSGTVPLSFAGGASAVHLHAPSDTKVRIELSGGSSSLRVNGARLGALGNDLTWESEGYAGASDRYLVNASGGATDLSWDS